MADEMPEKPEFNEAAPAGDGDEYLQLFADGIRQPEDPILGGAGSAHDLRLFDQVRADAQVYSCLQQRRDAVVSIPFDVAPGDEDDPRSVTAAEDLKADLDALDFDTRCKRMLWGVFYGYAVGEIMWRVDGQRIVFNEIRVRRARRFGFDKDGDLMLRSTTARAAERMPDHKFWVMTTGADTDDEPYGLGLGHLLYWPAYFKRHGLKAWMMALNKYATPTAVGTFPKGTNKDDVAKLLAGLRAIQTDSAFVKPEGMTAELLQSSKSAGIDYKAFHTWLEANVAKIILSQTMTTEDGSSRSQSETHMEVRDEVADSDASLLCGSFNEGPVTWWTAWNYGLDVAPPVVRRQKIEAEDAEAASARDERLAKIGWHPTAERVSDVYGEGYEYRDPVPPAANDDVLLLTEEVPALAADDPDAITEMVNGLMADGTARSAVNDMLAPIADALDGAGSLEELRDQLDAATDDDAALAPFREHLAQAMFAGRIGGEVGADLRDGVPGEEA